MYPINIDEAIYSRISGK